MYMVNSSEQGVSFWAKHKSLLDGVIKAVGLVIVLKMTKIAVEKLDL